MYRMDIKMGHFRAVLPMERGCGRREHDVAFCWVQSAPPIQSTVMNSKEDSEETPATGDGSVLSIVSDPL